MENTKTVEKTDEIKSPMRLIKLRNLCKTDQETKNDKSSISREVTLLQSL